MTEKKEAKKPMWEIASEEEIKKGREDWNKRIADDTAIAMKLKKRSEEFKPKPNVPPTLPTMHEFLMMTYLHKLDHAESLKLFQYLMECLIEQDKQLSIKLQYLEDNIQAISEQTGTKISGMKRGLRDVRLGTKMILDLLIQANTDEWRKMQGGPT
ncbi:hypothetical protein MUP77_09520 [Candidatus Bathyarchaeota archaeon]|nr:hypothetical protein [Candidatus Bathyarchaeota archaeon]